MRDIDNLEQAKYIADDSGVMFRELKEGESIVLLHAGDRILRHDSIFDPEKLEPIKMKFTKTNQMVYGKLAYKYPLLNLLMEYIQYQTGKLVYRNNVTINRKNLPKACGLSPATVDRQLKGLMKDDVIKSVRDGRDVIFFVNPYVVHVGKKVQHSLIEMFKNTRYSKTYEKTLDGDKK